MGTFPWLFDRCLIGVSRRVDVIGCGTCTTRFVFYLRPPYSAAAQLLLLNCGDRYGMALHVAVLAGHPASTALG